MPSLLAKIKKSLVEKRFLKAVKKKIYPYIKGFLLFFLFKSNKIIISVPKKNIIDRSDTQLVERIYNSYKLMKIEQKNKSDLYKPSSLWQNHIDKDFNFLKESLDSNNFDKFLFFLQNFGNWDKYLGIENQDLIKRYSKNIFLKKFLSDEMFYGQHQIWKYLTKEQSISPDSLNMPRFGNQTGAHIDNNFVVLGSFFNEIYSNMIIKLLNTNSHNTVVDIGGGYGKLGYYILKNLNKSTFIDFDIPEVLVLASYYLSKSFPNKKTFFYGEEKFNAENLKNYELIFLPPWEIEKIKDDTIDVVINKNSLGEMQPQTANNFIDHIHRISKYFFSMNHEFFRNQFIDGTASLINREFNSKGQFKEIVRYPDIGHMFYENNKVDFESDIFFNIYEKN